jgi:hypothetical protein
MMSLCRILKVAQATMHAIPRMQLTKKRLRQSPSQYKKTRRDDDDDAEKANESEESSDESTDQEIIRSIDRDAVLKFDCDKFIRRFDEMAEQLKVIMHVQKEHNATKCDRGGV